MTLAQVADALDTVARAIEAAYRYRSPAWTELADSLRPLLPDTADDEHLAYVLGLVVGTIAQRAALLRIQGGVDDHGTSAVGQSPPPNGRTP